MRRLFIFAATLVLLGLTTAFAASLTARSEDIDSFSTTVSISIPGPTPFPTTIYIRGNSDTPLGLLDLVLPTANDNVRSKDLLLSTETIQTQATSTKYFTWATPAAPAQGYSLTGDVTLSMHVMGGGSNRITAGLFSCPAAAAIETVTPACTAIAVGIAPAMAGGNGFLVRTVSFPAVAATIPAGSQLRLKIVNRSPDGSTVLSTGTMRLAWGYGPSRPAELVTTP
jgi:hypothetical protein